MSGERGEIRSSFVQRIAAGARENDPDHKKSLRYWQKIDKRLKGEQVDKEVQEDLIAERDYDWEGEARRLRLIKDPDYFYLQIGEVEPQEEKGMRIDRQLTFSDQELPLIKDILSRIGS